MKKTITLIVNVEVDCESTPDLIAMKPYLMEIIKDRCYGAFNYGANVIGVSFYDEDRIKRIALIKDEMENYENGSYIFNPTGGTY